MTDSDRKDNILSVYKDLGLSPSPAEGLNEADMTEDTYPAKANTST